MTAERQEIEITPNVIDIGSNNPHKEVSYAIFYDGHKLRAAIQGLRKKGLRNKMRMRLRTMAQEYGY